jgi:hypothetical protein
MKAEDYLELPPLLDIDRFISLPPDAMAKYERFERDLVIQMKDKEITAMNAGVLHGKLLQCANGALYDEDRTVHYLHDEKLEALDELIEEAQGNPMLVFYQYQHDLERMLTRFKSIKPRQLKTKADLIDWNAGRIRLCIVHPASAGHGLNLQFGGTRSAWFGTGNNLEQYQQGVKRLHRSGVAGEVLNTRLLCRDTADELALDNITGKALNQNKLLEYIKARLEKYTGKKY